jgi:hypothetical protein
MLYINFEMLDLNDRQLVMTAWNSFRKFAVLKCC